MHLTQARLVVTDFDATFRYYRDVIGLRPQFEPSAPPYAAFKPEHGSTLALHERNDLADALGGALRITGERGGDQAIVSLRVDDLDAYLGEVTGRGAVVAAGPVEFGGRIRSAYLRDPEGNLVEIQQWLTIRAGEPVPSAN
jgi:catechol 2,3-dioxygenase-like lactoylglutathione lyase family enzyme